MNEQTSMCCVAVVIVVCKCTYMFMYVRACAQVCVQICACPGTYRCGHCRCGHVAMFEVYKCGHVLVCVKVYMIMLRCASCMYRYL